MIYQASVCLARVGRWTQNLNTCEANNNKTCIIYIQFRQLSGIEKPPSQTMNEFSNYQKCKDSILLQIRAIKQNLSCLSAPPFNRTFIISDSESQKTSNYIEKLLSSFSAEVSLKMSVTFVPLTALLTNPESHCRKNLTVIF